ncbi:hypothetical protein K432DRAFT_421764 [Lepidopterella palustris CBS 459.81]|uniref:Uncharacterized protein n=1 Tax=Lepidopterella palustris CBS 459.81 TaxID=1314670 RepID=A0A8E2JK05_9PEZI|nr:hypothetical protein K432DRAFT_421764 [Lepidopterella palustris CBS 459.81]
MSSSDHVRTGKWIDYSHHNRTQLLESDFWAEWFKSLAAVCLALSGPYIFAILKNLIVGLHWWWNYVPDRDENQPLLDRRRSPRSSQRIAATQHRARQPDNVAAEDGDQSQGNANSQSVEDEDQDNQADSRDAIGPMEVFMRAKGGRETIKEFFNSVFQDVSGFSAQHATIMVVILTAILAVFVAQIVANVFSAKIATDRAALSSSKFCGIYDFNGDDAGPEDAARADVYNYQQEARAGEYAQNCYGSQNATASMRCNFFYKRSISVKYSYPDRCPFETHPDRRPCYGGLYSAVTFDTGIVDASELGINSKITHKFRRKSTCVPLSMEYPFVRNVTTHNSNSPTFHYYYGGRYSLDEDDYKCSFPKLISNYTYETSGNPYDWLAPVYSVSTYSTSLYPECDYWQPLPELKPPENSTLTIMFVSSMHIDYLKRSEDPIFPATKPRNIPGFRDPFYYNDNPIARALACVDTTELCSPDETVCWSMTADLPDEVPHIPAYWLMKWSLENSNIYDSIKWRLGTALLAQQKISQSVSRPLKEDHWKEEARALFETSLARIQYDAWSIANGEGREKTGYIDYTPDEGKNKLCGLYKFNSTGYTNVNLWAFIGFVFVLPTTFILSIETNTFIDCFSGCRGRGREAPPDGEDTSTRSWEPLLFVSLLQVVYYSLRLPFWGIYWLYKKL